METIRWIARLETAPVAAVNAASNAACPPRPSPQEPKGQRPWWPGLGLASVVAVLATLLAKAVAATSVPASPLVLALLLGLVVAQLRPPGDTCERGLQLAGRPLLRLAILGLGARIGSGPLAALGGGGVLLLLAVVATTLAFGWLIARWLRLDRDLGWLLAAGHAICGAAAIVAADSMLRARPRDTAQAIAAVTLFGTLAMLLYPWLGAVFGLDAGTCGFWIGGSVHEVAQAIAAGFACGELCGEAASVVKLARVSCLLPLGLLLLAVVRRRGEARGRVTVPWFVFGFALVAAANVGGLLPAAVGSVLTQLSAVLMTVAMAALGLGSSLREVLAGGRRPLVAAAATTTFVGVVALLAARLAAG